MMLHLSVRCVGENLAHEERRFVEERVMLTVTAMVLKLE